MQLIALTGGIACGKTLVAAHLETLGAKRIDSDDLARQAVAVGTAGLREIAAQFGASYLHDDGTLNRAKLGQKVFNDPIALAKLNSIVHPAVRQLLRERLREIAVQHPAAIVIYEIPLFVESNAAALKDPPWDLVVTVEAGSATQIARLQKFRAMTREAAAARLRAQASSAARRASADVVIDSSGSIAATLAQATALWERLNTAT